MPKFTFQTCYYIQNWFLTKYILIYFITFVLSVSLTPVLDYAERKQYDDIPKQTWAISDTEHSARVILIPLFSRFGQTLRTFRPLLSLYTPLSGHFDPLTIPLSFFRESKAVLASTIIFLKILLVSPKINHSNQMTTDDHNFWSPGFIVSNGFSDKVLNNIIITV